MREGALGQVAFVRGVAGSTYQFGRRPGYRRRCDLGAALHRLSSLRSVAVPLGRRWRKSSPPPEKRRRDTTATVTARMASESPSLRLSGARPNSRNEIYGDAPHPRIDLSIRRFRSDPDRRLRGTSGATTPPFRRGSRQSRACGASVAARRGLPRFDSFAVAALRRSHSQRHGRRARPRGRPAIPPSRARGRSIGGHRPGGARQRRAAHGRGAASHVEARRTSRPARRFAGPERRSQRRGPLKKSSATGSARRSPSRRAPPARRLRPWPTTGRASSSSPRGRRGTTRPSMRDS